MIREALADSAQLAEHLIGGLDQHRAIANQFVTAAGRAVISEPDFRPASMTSVPRLKPAMMRLRRGKCSGLPDVPGGNSLTSAPLARIRAASSPCWRG